MLGAADALDRALAGLLAGSGARAVRVVDGTGVVVAAVPARGAPGDDPAVVARLVADAVLLGRGGLDDVLVTTRSAVHLLRPMAASGAFLHLTADPDVDPAVARRLLADPALHAAVGAAVAPFADVPAQRTAPRPDPTRAVDARVVRDLTGSGELPALAGLLTTAGRTGAGARAVEALTRMAPAARPPAQSVLLPRRSPAGAPAVSRATATTGLPERCWAGDLDTMRRLLVGLRRLA